MPPYRQGGDGTKVHYNLYYLFLEDKIKKPLPAQQREKILQTIQEFYKKKKLP